MNDEFTVVAVGNYPADTLESMRRFAKCLESLLLQQGVEVMLVVPSLKWGKALGQYSYRGIPKWLGYIDKYLVFPRELQQRLVGLRKKGRVIIHVLDHGNANYVPRKKLDPWVVTCHDLLAVRAALGEDTRIRPSLLGCVQQKAVLAGLARADQVVSVSHYTQNDWQALRPNYSRAQCSVVWNGLNHPYRRLGASAAWSRIKMAGFAGLQARPFLFHIGSNHPRKNRDGVLRMAARLAQIHDVSLVLAGPELDEALSAQAVKLGFGSRLIVIARPSNDLVEALYATAHALLFPSHFEGFGWPVAEAQACGCPVVCSNSSSLPEVAGEGALLHPVADEAGMVDSLVRLFDPVVRVAQADHGFSNVKRFAPYHMAQGYLEIYRKLVQASQSDARGR